MPSLKSLPIAGQQKLWRSLDDAKAYAYGHPALMDPADKEDSVRRTLVSTLASVLAALALWSAAASARRRWRARC